MKSYYAQDGASFYAIGIPMLESVKLLKSGGMEREAEELLRYYEIHGEMLIKNGLCYPPHEVKYEQSIVAPAVNYLFQLYELTGKILYLEEGKKQLAVLVLFNGHQPDFHMKMRFVIGMDIGLESTKTLEIHFHITGVL